MDFDLLDLRLFLHVVAEGSITAGARQVHLSLPSASARVRALEHQAGVELLRRQRRGVRPTPAGSALARHAREVLEQVSRLDGAVASYARPSTAALVLLAGSSAMHQLVPRALIPFLRDHPDVDVTVAEHRSTRIVRLLAEGRADLGVVLTHEAAGSGLRTEPLGADPLVVIGRRGGVLAGRDALSYPEVTEHPLVGLPEGSPLRQWIETSVGEHGPAVRYRTQVADLGVVIALAQAGVGLAVVPQRALAPGQPLEVCELTDPWARRHHSLCRGVGRSVEAAGALADALLEQAVG